MKKRLLIRNFIEPIIYMLISMFILILSMIFASKIHIYAENNIMITLLLLFLLMLICANIIFITFMSVGLLKLHYDNKNHK